jgi:hypothetical protein
LNSFNRHDQFFCKPARQCAHFNHSFQKEKIRCQEFEMLHRMTTLLSAVVVASVAAFVLNAVFPIAAWADNCIARPAGDPGAGRHWYFRIDRVTHQKCWRPGGKKTADVETATVRDAVMPILFDLTRVSAFAEPAPAKACIVAPTGRPARGGHWHSRVDDATGQRCRWRSASAQLRKPHVKHAPETRRPANDPPASSPGSAMPAAPATPLDAFRRAFANARAEFPAPFNVADLGIESESSPMRVTTEATYVSFASRWDNLPDPAPSVDHQPGPPAQLRSDRLVAAALDDVTNSTRAGDRLFSAERSLYITVLVFLAALLGSLVVFGLIGGAFLYMRARYARSAPPGGPNAPPEDSEFSDGGAVSADPDREL